ncbi:MAG TPA: PAS domain S-box protein [Bryobacteraceae bacterium]|nr:PAS domain S-box protein [Bryobacteraceae bacterium]
MPYAKRTEISPDTPRPSGLQVCEALADAVDGMAWEISLPSLAFTFVSPRAEQILGYAQERWLGDANFLSDHLHPRDAWVIERLRGLAESAGEERPIEFRMISGDRKARWLTDLVRLQAADERPLCARGVLVDITIQKKKEILHAGQMRVLETIAGGAPLHGILASIVDLIEPQSDGMLCSILLLRDDGKHVMHGAAPNLPEGYIGAINGAPIGPKAGSCGTAMFRGKQVIVTDIMEDLLWEDYRGLASQFGLRACWSTPIISHKGQVLGSFAMYYHEPRSPGPEEIHLIDVATHVAAIAIERQQAEEKIRSSEERYRNIVDTANEGIWIIDAANRLSFVNSRMAEMFGYSVEEMKGRPSRDFIKADVAEQATQLLARRREGIREQFDFPFVTKDGSELWGLVSTTPMRDEEGQFSGALAMITDITERKRAEAELRSSRDQIREMANKVLRAQEEERRRISRELHDDIVQKVAALAMGVSRVKRKAAAVDESIAPEFVGLQHSIHNLAGDVRRLSHRLHPAVLEHGGLMAALKSFTEEFSQSEGLEVALTVPDTREPIPQEVGACVYRVTQEWLRNIAKYARAKSAVAVAIDGGHLRLVIKDEGPGFDVERARGKGLGLVSIEERVRFCQGTVRISSEPGRGSTLEAIIPVG